MFIITRSVCKKSYLLNVRDFKMIMHNLKTFCFICIVFASLQTSHAIQENCAKFKTDTSISCKTNHVQFFLKTKKGNEFHELDVETSSTIINAGFIPGKKIKFIVHGHSEKHDDFLVSPLQEEYFDLGYNVVAIDYYELSKPGCYRTGVENSLSISTCAARMIEAIIEHKKVKLQDFHLIGLSLGGQMVGQIPNIVRKEKVGNGKFSRITGIDPANDGFFEDYETDQYTLNKDDAELVDVIHTSSGFDGKFQPMGYIDWYPNLGIFQPECKIGDHLCNHMRSLILYLESIGDPNFQIEAERCANLETKFLNPKSPCEKIDKIHFGENFVKDGKNGGVYFFNTEKKAPYIRKDAKTSYDVYKIHLDLEKYLKGKTH